MKSILKKILPKGEFAKNTLTLTLGTSIAQFFPLLFYPILGRIFTPEEFGLLATLTSITAILGVLATGKYDQGILIADSKKEAADLVGFTVLLPKFKAFKEYELDDINKAAALYTEKLKDVVKTPITPQGYYSSWAQYTLILDNREQRDDLQAHLKEQGIPSMVYYPKALHDQSAYKHLGYEKGSSPVAEMLAECVLSLPIHPYITVEDIEKVSICVSDFLK